MISFLHADRTLGSKGILGAVWPEGPGQNQIFASLVGPSPEHPTAQTQYSSGLPGPGAAGVEAAQPGVGPWEGSSVCPAPSRVGSALRHQARLHLQSHRCPPVSSLLSAASLSDKQGLSLLCDASLSSRRQEQETRVIPPRQHREQKHALSPEQRH